MPKYTIRLLIFSCLSHKNLSKILVFYQFSNFCLRYFYFIVFCHFTALNFYQLKVIDGIRYIKENRRQKSRNFIQFSQKTCLTPLLQSLNIWVCSMLINKWLWKTIHANLLSQRITLIHSKFISKLVLLYLIVRCFLEATRTIEIDF